MTGPMHSSHNWRAADPVTDGKLASAVLTLMREPQRVIERVDEVCRVTRRELIRDTKIRVMAPSGVNTFYLDILHPKKGAAAHVHFATQQPGVETVSHDEHFRAAETLIQYRLLSLRRSAQVPPAMKTALNRAMQVAYVELSKIPRANKDKAGEILRSQFSKDHILTALFDAPGVSVDLEKAQGLYRLCKRLAYRYLLLLRIDFTTETRSREIEFRDRAELSRYTEDNGVFQYNAPIGRKLFQLAPPTPLRIHVPWAKRTDHYTCEIEAPDTFFFINQAVLVKRGGRPKVARSRNASGPKWIIGTNRGVRSEAFISNGRAESGRLYLGMQALEQPGHSTSRAFIVALFAFAVMLGFTIVRTLFDGNVFNPASLILALMAIGAFFSNSVTSSPIVSTPVLSRLVPAAVASLSVAYIMWLASSSLTRNENIISRDFASLAAPVTSGIEAWAGWVITAAVGVLLIVIDHRRRRLKAEYGAAYLLNEVASPNFY